MTANAAGQRVTELRYYPFGLDRYDAGAQKTVYRFTGQRSEANSDPHFCGHPSAGFEVLLLSRCS